ncbi:alpha/beta hydrolase [Dehalobacter sp. DCM]|uniref:alpha/beta fold hydrolase n=1 Tax=Dehalobacter sp. DCM TaxID=2907827 RepID=UPI003081E30B|nr:alpha/beta hydrolase [Dehalobacter sp. DCM]
MEKMSGFLTLPDSNFSLFMRRWIPKDAPVIGIVLIIHGIAEHSRRYAPFAERLTEAGYVVYAYDQRGHGKTIQKPEDQGDIGKDGWKLLSQDVHGMITVIQGDYADLPLFIFSHSLGTLVTQSYLSAYRDQQEIAGVILSGPVGEAKPRLIFGRFLSRVLTLLKGKQSKSKLLQTMSFQNFNAKCAEQRTTYDWLTRDTTIVDSYIQDECCGHACTTWFYHELAVAVMMSQSQSKAEQIPKDIPVLIFSGSMDPVTQYGRVAENLNRRYREAGIKDVTLRIYAEGRHESINEINRDEVIADIIGWLDSK